MFPYLPTSGNIVAKTEFASKEAKMFLNKFRNIFVAEAMFPSSLICFQMFAVRLPTVANMRKHRQKTMFPQQCFLVFLGLKGQIMVYSNKKEVSLSACRCDRLKVLIESGSWFLTSSLCLFL